MSERVESLLEQIAQQQETTNQLISTLVLQVNKLIEALAEEGQDPDAQPDRYLDGCKVS
ncbi:hypothetical protein ACM8AR_21690 [Pseudomonas aeruginosa]|uniref:hypothetical protein n=1 Tax=Pseudomonas aeruginosa TaxID=287 RepID=UPI002A6B0EE3|nr:hypothetical protein [Pseudomonas aeruginosa]MDY1279629.1 hypothetical protein [Pseudomonas aeruginosa]